MTALDSRRPSREERMQLGRDARTRVPLSAHGDWRPAPDRPDPVALLEEQAQTRIPELIPVRYGRMLASPFSFYRGAALPMAADLAKTPTSGIHVQLGGDAHISNFGLFASPERDELFDMNDFDETLPGPWEWDVKRLAASLVVAARGRGFDVHQARHHAHAAVRSYRERMHEYAEMRAVDVYYSLVDVTGIMAYVAKRARPYLQTTVRSTAHRDALHELPKLTTLVDGKRRITDHPPMVTHVPWIDRTVLAEGLGAYRLTLQEDRRVLLDRYAVIDVAQKVVGVGSVGLNAMIALMDGGGGDDPLFLQVKEAEASVLERFLGPSEFGHHGQRVVSGQRRLQAASDILLGWTTGPRGRHLYVRQLQDQKGGAVIDAMTKEDLATWGELCGWALARSHARSGDPAAIAGYLGPDTEFDEAIARFATTYADQAERDHTALAAAVKAGRVPAESGV
jgi:uncharacterized protein (DUF2252 family)